MKLWENYHTPQSIDEAVETLVKYGGNARVVAGGTDLLIDMRAEGNVEPHVALVDVTSIPELCDITESDGEVIIGAGVTHTQIVKSPLIAEKATCLVESCGVVGGPQVRNVATLGGNVAHALPAGDGTTSLVALNAEVEIIKDNTRQWVDILEMYLGPGKSLLETGKDILLRFKFKLTGENEGTAFSRIMRPQGVALPVLGCAVWVKLDESKANYADVRICIAPAAPTPVRATEVEAVLKGQPVGEASLAAAVEAAHKAIHPRTSKYRATADYRQEMMDVLLRRTLPKAAERAASGEAVPEGVGV